ncbi:RNA polymerase II-associated protein 3 [Grifola frondosa]|uniref:RNA polymerase II-associated protein 3 n=1 Tax=Grifola frondosa TaxID=5627 RepID=A0A1C7M6W6_GRIFR|nr:RNA polymerase II-associated protein 3 [Grifola frondosa]
MPAKYSHVKKRSTGPSKKSANGAGHVHHHNKDHRNPNPHLDRHLDRSITQAMSAVSQLEHTIARIILLRFQQDIARLFSTHLYCVALLHLPTFVMRCISIGGPSWVAANADSDEIKDFFRGAIGMDLRQAGERVATKSVLWTYTALRHFAMSNGVSICQKRGLHSLRLLPHYSALKAHLESLEALRPPSFAKPPHLGPMIEGVRALEDACETKFGKGMDWRPKVRLGYERVCATLWRVAREFDVRGYGLVLREKLTTKWCDCGCSTDHLSEVCERTVRLDEEESGVRPGKEREWDGRGSGVYGWETEEEEDIWEIDFDFVGLEPEDSSEGPVDCDMTIGELMEWRYLRAEREKEQGNVAFKKGEYEVAIERYKAAHQIEPEMPHYQLNIAAAYLKLRNYINAEKACDMALGQHKSLKGHWRRAQARKLQGRIDEAIKDLRAVLRIQPTNAEALAELTALLPPEPTQSNIASTDVASSSSTLPASSSAHTTASSKYRRYQSRLTYQWIIPSSPATGA